jgi:hypothetical protein
MIVFYEPIEVSAASPNLIEAAAVDIKVIPDSLAPLSITKSSAFEQVFQLLNFLFLHYL